MKLLGSVLLSLLLAQVAGCADEEQEDLEELYGVDPAWATDQYYASYYEVAGYYPMVDPLDDPAYYSDDFFLSEGATSELDPARAASDAAEAADQYFTPASCVSAAADGATVSYSLDGCTGPLGVGPISGQITGVYSNQGGSLGVAVTSQDLVIDVASINHDSAARFSTDENGVRTLEIVSNTTASGRHNTAQREVTIDASWQAGSECALIEVGGQFEIDDDELIVSIEDVTQCAGACPSAGTMRVIRGEGSLTVTFDGTDQPSFVTDEEDTGNIQLFCVP